jgi:DNA-directed RNA polymerase II subunit RPB2
LKSNKLRVFAAIFEPLKTMPTFPTFPNLKTPSANVVDKAGPSVAVEKAGKVVKIKRKASAANKKTKASSKKIQAEGETKLVLKSAIKTQEQVDLNAEDRWSIVESYFKMDHLAQLVRHQRESYNDFINHQLKQTINMFNPLLVTSVDEKMDNKVRVKIHITFENLKLFRPEIFENNGSSKVMFPNEARLRNFTYASAMNLDLNIKYEVSHLEEGTSETIIQVLPGINIGKMPIMLHSDLCVLQQYKAPHFRTDECRFDPGGYFIINGSEKTIIAQERAAENQIYCFNTKKTASKWGWQAEVRSVPDWKQISPKLITLLMTAKTNEHGHPIYVQLPKLKNPVPLFILFKALGIISDKDVCSYILLNPDAASEMEVKMLKSLKASIVEACGIYTQDEAFQYVLGQVIFSPYNMSVSEGKRAKELYTHDILGDELFPHCRTSREKIFYLGWMTNNLLKTSLGYQEQSDRDSYVNKRIDTCGILLNNLFRNYFNKMVKDMQKQILKEIHMGSWKTSNDFKQIINMTNIYKIVKPSTIENGLKRALATGDFGLKHAKSNKVGVAQVLNRLTYIATLSHSRRVNTPIDKSGKLIPPRKLHNTTWGFLCPAETPEGHSVGVVKNLSYLAHITQPSNSDGLYDYVAPYTTSLEEIDEPSDIFQKVKVVINGCWVGITERPMELFTFLKAKKEQGIIQIMTAVVFDYTRMEIHLDNSAGRLVRPVMRIKNNRPSVCPEVAQAVKSGEILWEHLLTSIQYDQALLEYIDPYEQNHSMIAMRPHHIAEDPKTRFTHCEIHPSSIFGILASCIPFPEHNQSPRNTYQCAMGKQAMGVYASNFDARMDKTAFVLTYPMRPLVDTRVMDFIKLHHSPSGCPIIVAIMTHSGYNQEDSILFNRGAIDRGLFQATIFHTEKDEDKKLHGDSEMRCKPDPKRTKGMKFGNYDKINADGVMPENSRVEDKDIIIAKVVPIKENRNDYTKVIKYEDHSRIHRTDEEIYVDKNYLSRNGDGYNICKVRLRAVRHPVIGDKFSSRHGQKGTIGNIIEEEDMPFAGNGLKPDIIINPHAIPSRMTIAQLKETLLGKVLLELGLFGDGTSFEELDIKKIRTELLKQGYESNGNEVLYNGMTGEQLETSIFIGPCFYQRLKHMVNDKYHSRAIGPMVNLTRQPAEGRSRDGGLRFGEMERDCMISHGAAAFTKERVYDVSDKYKVYVCRDCGNVAAFNQKAGIYHCNYCQNGTDFARVELPYSCKLLFQELMTMNVMPRIITEEA